ncbi:MAG: CoA transferase, partial [Pseudomonadota bacterium]
MMEADKASLPLEGIRVVDWTTAQAGPSCTQLLGDMGADVIKVETPTGGDQTRSVKDAGAWLTLSHGMSYTFENINRNKRSIAVNIAKAEGKKIVYSLVAKSDVLVQNFRHGVAKKLGMDYETLQKYNATLVYANCTGYGPRGKQVAQTAMDPAIHAASGMMLGIGEATMPPIHLPGAISDQTTAIMLAYDIMVGLFCRDRKGIGQEINVSMLGTMVWVQTNNLLYTILAKKARERQL